MPQFSEKVSFNFHDLARPGGRKLTEIVIDLIIELRTFFAQSHPTTQIPTVSETLL